MDLPEILIIDLGWIFFAAWGIVLATVSAIAFGRDLLPFTTRMRREPERH